MAGRWWDIHCATPVRTNTRGFTVPHQGVSFCKPDFDSRAICADYHRLRHDTCSANGANHYVSEQFGADSPLAQQCGYAGAESGETCAVSDCTDVSAESAVVSVAYVTCPDLTTVLGAAMGYLDLFVVEFAATALIVLAFTLVTGRSCHSAWDQTRNVLREDMATEEAEARTLSDEDKRLGTTSSPGLEGRHR